ncbi:MAG: prepilin-type N-terminal cleavage/methylation domain-containing protein [Desulfobacterales bacterium]|nr:prepilin-type N-terminal cleavage/methylation domain-containing protein [Desulfobacterales bacterium]
MGEKGFTLLELTLVVALMGIVLAFAIPRFESRRQADDTDRASRWIRLTVQQLKTDALRSQHRHALHLDLDAQKMWWTHDAMSDVEIQSAVDAGITLSGKVRIQGVELPGKTMVSEGQAVIRFYPAGYSGMAMIHLAENQDRPISISIEPFLPHSRQYEGQVALADRHTITP